MKVEERRMEVDVFKWEGGKEMEEGEEWIMKKKISKPENWEDFYQHFLSFFFF